MHPGLDSKDCPLDGIAALLQKSANLNCQVILTRDAQMYLPMISIGQ